MNNLNIATKRKNTDGFSYLQQIMLTFFIGLGITLSGIATAQAGAAPPPPNSPPIITSINTTSVPENQTSAIDIQSTDDFDSEGDGLTYSKTGGADQTLFNLDANTGLVTFIIAPDFEVPGDAGEDNNYDIQVTITDTGFGDPGYKPIASPLDDEVVSNSHETPLSAVQDIVITVTDVDENTAPTITSSNTASVPENQTSAIDVQSSDDFDSEGDGLTYSKTGGADQALFNLDANTGVVTFINAPDFEVPGDAGEDNNYDIQVTVTDSGFFIEEMYKPIASQQDDAEVASAPGIPGLVLITVQNIVITVTDVVENTAPIITSSTFASVPENQTSVINVESTDDFDSENDGLTYSITGGDDQALFNLDANTGVMTFINAPDFEAPITPAGVNNYEVYLTVTDTGGLTDFQNIDITVTDVNESVVIQPLWIPVDRSSDDAEEQVSNGDMYLNSSDLELTRESSSQLIGIRFNGLNIPAGSTILNAHIQFTVDETDTEQTDLTIQAEDTGNAATFNNTDFDISSRMPTTAQVQWDVPEWNSTGVAGPDQATPNLSAVLQEVIDGCCWTSGNSVAFIITGSGKRVAESFDGTAPPILHVEFSDMPLVPQAPDAVDDGTDTDPAYSTGLNQQLIVPNGPQDIVERNDNVGYPAAEVFGFGPGRFSFAGQPGFSFKEGELTVYADGSFNYIPRIGFSGFDYFDYHLENGGGEDSARVYIEVLNQTPLWISVDRSSDDAEEELSSGNMDLSSSDLELTQESSKQLIGIRYNGLTIPQGATILGAYIQFTSDETDSEPTDLTIQAEATGNAATFNNTNFDISSRIPTSAYMQWTVPEWDTVGATGPDQATPDLSAIIQELVDRNDWGPGNSIAFIITGSGKRVAESYNGTAPPMLHLIYSNQPPVNQAPDAVDDGSFDEPAYSSNSLGLTVPNGPEDIVERNDDTGFPAAEVYSFGPSGPGVPVLPGESDELEKLAGGEFPAGVPGFSTMGGNLTVYADGSFSYSPPEAFSGVDFFDYVLKNSLDQQDTATVFIEVFNETPLWVSVDRSSDDAEEEVSNGIMDLTSSDLELPRESSDQLVGIRFNGLTIPRGAIIVEAYLQFQVDETDSEPTVLTLKAEDIGDAPTFSNTNSDISSRTSTTAQMQWTVPAWNTIGTAGFDQATPDLAALVQEVVNRGDWAIGNSMAFINTGSGKRVAESFNGTAPPTLHVTYSNRLPR